MPIIFGAGARAAVVRVECPFCGEIQARARGKKGTTYACRKCGKTIPAEAVEGTAKKHGAPPTKGRGSPR